MRWSAFRASGIMVAVRIVRVVVIVGALTPLLVVGVADAAPGPPIVLSPGDTIRVHGTGCGPGAEVRVVLAASHATGTVLDTFPADERGSFSRSIAVPFAGEPDASLVADCADPANNTLAAFEANVE
jgi:hypothetical protein